MQASTRSRLVWIARVGRGVSASEAAGRSTLCAGTAPTLALHREYDDCLLGELVCEPGSRMRQKQLLKRGIAHVLEVPSIDEAC